MANYSELRRKKLRKVKISLFFLLNLEDCKIIYLN